MQNLVGCDLDHYRVVEQLGEGGMATVYKAFDRRLERTVALKVIRTDWEGDPEFLARFEREARALARLAHPNIVRVFTYGQSGDLPYLVMEYIPGGTLKRYAGQALSAATAARLLAPIARALDYAHQQQLVHRDVKPANILLSSDGQPLLSDFGIARMLGREQMPGLTRTGYGVGTAEYMAPEQWDGNAGPASDVYALGVVLYELLTGRLPYTADSPTALLVKQMTEPLPSPRSIVPDLPAEVETILSIALARRPADRYATMGEFAGALDRLAVASPAAPASPPRRGRLWLPLAGLAAALLIVVAVVMASLRGGASQAISTSAAGSDPSGIATPGTTTAGAVSAPVDYAPKTAAALAPPTSPQPTTAASPGQSLATTDQSVISRDNLAATSALGLASPAASGSLGNIRWSPDGTWIAATAAGPDWKERVAVLIYDSQTLQARYSLAVTTRTEVQLAFSPDSAWLAFGTTDGQINVLDLASGQPIATLRVSSENADAAVFTPDGALLIGGAFDGTVKIWRTSDWQEVRTLQAKGNARNDLQLVVSQDGQLLIADGRPITVWEIASGSERDLGAELKASYISLARDGRLALYLNDTEKQQVSLLDLSNAKQVLIDLSRGFQGFDFTSDGTTMITFGESGWSLWDTQTGAFVMTISGGRFYRNDMPVSPDGRLMALPGESNRVELWGIKPGATPRPARPAASDPITFMQPTVSALFTPPEGVEVISEQNVERLAALTSIVPADSSGVVVGVSGVRWSADGRRLAVLTAGRLAAASGMIDLNGVQVYDAATLQPLCWAPYKFANANSWAISADGTLLVTPRDGASVWEIDGCSERFSLGQIDTRSGAIAISPDGTLLATSAVDNSVHLWNLATGQEHAMLQQHSDMVYALAFSPDGALLASASDDGTTRVWEVATGKRSGLIMAGNHFNTPMVFLADSQSLLVGGQIYAAAGGQARRKLEGCCDGGINDATVSPDGRLLVFGNKLYDLASGRELRRFNSTNKAVYGASAFSPDGKRLAFASAGSVEVWGAAP